MPRTNAEYPLLLMPVENQVRELDPKLLFACVAARRGFPSIIGPRREMHLRLASFPRSIYVSKSMTTASVKVFRILRKLGHGIVAWDEEALVHPPAETYYARRLSADAMHHVTHLFAWGRDNLELWSRYPGLREGTPIHLTGNPRGDLLRPDVRIYYEREAEEIRNRYGPFLLVNTNFNHVNGYDPILNLFQPVTRPGQQPARGRAGKGMTREYAEGLRSLKQAVFEDFQGLIPNLEKAFPNLNIVVRPHPTENQTVYRDIAARCQRVHVTNEGNVVPWLMATRALVHNGCTTGVEAYAMGVPAVSYHASVDERYDLGFYGLPNSLSCRCFRFEELRETVQRILDGEDVDTDEGQRLALVDQYLVGRDGPLACERIVDVLAQVSAEGDAGSPTLWDQLEGRYQAMRRRFMKRIKARLPGYSHNRADFQRHRYPEISLGEFENRVQRFQHVLGEGPEVRVERVFDQFYRVAV